MLSIYARPPFIGNRYPNHFNSLFLNRVSSRVRGEELSQYGGFKLNPDKREGVCVWVKPYGVSYVRDGDYIDFLDGGVRFEGKLKDRPGIKIIASSLHSYNTLKEIYKNEIILILSQHLNWERYENTRQEVFTCGYIGSPSPLALRIYKEIEVVLASMGIRFVTCFDFKTRLDAVNFYRSIDVLIVGAWSLGDANPHKIPTKLINAASFGVPTLAYPLDGYKEIEGYYHRISNLEDLIFGVKMFKDSEYYRVFSDKIRRKAEEYHISHIVKMFEALC